MLRSSVSTSSRLGQSSNSTMNNYAPHSASSREEEEDVDDFDFSKALDSQLYLDKEKTSATFRRKDNNIDDGANEEGEDSFAAFARKRQSVVGSYLFGADLRNENELMQTIKIHVDTVPAVPALPKLRKTPSFINGSGGSPLTANSNLSPLPPTLEDLAVQAEFTAQKAIDGDEREESQVLILSNTEDGFTVLLQRVKVACGNARDAAAFMRRRAQVEADYAQMLLKLGTVPGTVPAKAPVNGISQSNTVNVRNSTASVQAVNGGSRRPKQESTFVKNVGFSPLAQNEAFIESWTKFESMHSRVGDARAAFSKSILEMADNIEVLHKNTERTRKQLKESRIKHQKEVFDVEEKLEKARYKFETSSNDWERTLSPSDAPLSPTGSMHHSSSTSTLPTPSRKLDFKAGFNMLKSKLQHDLFQPKSVEEAKTRATTANFAYQSLLTLANNTRSAYFKIHLPQCVRTLKEANDDCEAGLVKYLKKYAKCTEDMVMVEATTISPLEVQGPGSENEQGLMDIVTGIKPQADFARFCIKLNEEGKKLNKTEHVYNPYSFTKNVEHGMNRVPILSVPPPTSFHKNPTTLKSSVVQQNRCFGSTLPLLLSQSSSPVPAIVSNCVEFIEATGGLTQEGLYRMSGMGSGIKELRGLLDTDQEFALKEVVQDLHCVTGVLKQFFRDLQERVIPREMFAIISRGAKIEDERLRLIHIHEQVNNLHDANYATLKYLARHLNKVSEMGAENKMSAYNLGIVWGPTLLDSDTLDANDLKLASTVVEVIIENYVSIFDEE